MDSFSLTIPYRCIFYLLLFIFFYVQKVNNLLSPHCQDRIMWDMTVLKLGFHGQSDMNPGVIAYFICCLCQVRICLTLSFLITMVKILETSAFLMLLIKWNGIYLANYIDQCLVILKIGQILAVQQGEIECQREDVSEDEHFKAIENFILKLIFSASYFLLSPLFSKVHGCLGAISILKQQNHFFHHLVIFVPLPLPSFWKDLAHVESRVQPDPE